MDDQWVEVEGRSLHILHWGDPTEAAPLVLLHSLGENAQTWTQLAKKWGTTRSVYAIDLPGHGQSQRSTSYSFEQMRDDVTAAVEQLDLDDVTIIGHSLGGIIGYLVASQLSPRLGRLVLEEAPPPLPVDPPRAIPPDPGDDFGFDWRALTDLYAQRNNPDPQWWTDLQLIDVAVLVIAGDDQSHVNQADIAAMADRIPHADLVTIDAGHNIHATEPEAFQRAIEHFLTG